MFDAALPSPDETTSRSPYGIASSGRRGRALTTQVAKRSLTFFGPALLVCVGYMDPGNWATDIEAGSRFGYQLLFVVALSSLLAIFLQCLAFRLGVATGADLAQNTRLHSRPRTTYFLWALAEISIVACDLAEVLGCALAFHLLFHVSLGIGVALTALDTIIVLGLREKGFKRIESIVLGLIAVIAICFVYELVVAQPHWPSVVRGLVPNPALFATPAPWYIAIGILGATVMPHNLYLHSSAVQSRVTGTSASDKKRAIRLLGIDTVGSLTLAFFVNAAILVLAAAAFNGRGHNAVNDIEEAYHLLQPVVGSYLAPILFGVALLASGQSSTLTGTMAGNIILEGHLNLKISRWKRRLITRALALVPAYVGIRYFGSHSTGKLLVLSQVVLSLQLPFAIYPLVRLNSRKDVVGEFALSRKTQIAAWLVFTLITTANLWLITQFLTN